jgi:hypothetical protein
MDNDTKPKLKPIDVPTQVREAVLLMEHAVNSGYRREDGTTVPEDVIRAIKTTATALGIEGVVRTPPLLEGKDIPEDLWIAFELAYYKLSIFMSPITAKTLRDTDDVGQVGFWHFSHTSPAQAFTRRLWLVAIGFAIFVVLGEWGIQYYGPVQDGIVDPEN